MPKAIFSYFLFSLHLAYLFTYLLIYLLTYLLTYLFTYLLTYLHARGLSLFALFFI